MGECWKSAGVQWESSGRAQWGCRGEHGVAEAWGAAQQPEAALGHAAVAAVAAAPPPAPPSG